MEFEKQLFLIVAIFVLGAHSSNIQDIFYGTAQNPFDSSRIIETISPTNALQIWKERVIFQGKGVRHVCQSYDGKSNFIDGDIVCKKALPKLLLSGVTLSERPSCLNVSFTKYKRTKSGNYEPEDEDGSTFMAKCRYNYIKEVRNFGIFYVSNGPQKNSYYVFVKDDENKKATVEAILNIEVKKEDFPQVTVKDTKIPQEADNIFGVCGRISEKKKDAHICEKKNAGNFSRICTAVLYSGVLFDVPQDPRAPLIMSPAKCELVNIARNNIIRPKTFQVATQKSLGLTCVFEDKNKKKYKFMVFDGPSNQYYYLAKYKKINGLNQMAIQACTPI